MQYPRRLTRTGSAFTLIELLIVIAIIAVLATVIVLALSPAQLLMQSRDANRLSDLADINEAVALYNEDVGGNLGAASTSYFSIPDPSATGTLGDQCQGLNLATTSGSFSFQCSASSTYRLVNGTGWIPLNLNLISSGSPFGMLPIDPANQTSSGLFYAYNAQGSQYVLTAVLV